MSGPKHEGGADPCRTCRGSGADPLSDNVNWLPCQTCGGSGKKPARFGVPHRFAWEQNAESSTDGAIK